MVTRDPLEAMNRKGAALERVENSESSEVIDIIRSCLLVDLDMRISLLSLEELLIDNLRNSNLHAYDNLRVLLDYYDQCANESEQGGWPYYDQRLQDVGRYFSEQD